MDLLAAGLGALAVVLAWPAPMALAAARWPARRPAVAMLCWQAVAVAGGLSTLGALVLVGVHTLRVGSERFWADAAFTAAALLSLHLLANLAATVVSTVRRQRRHRQLVALLSSPMPDRPGFRLLDNEAPVAYCLPGAPRSVTVLSAGLVRLLDERELQGVIEHERAHVTQYHHIVLVAFEAWRIALPWFPVARRAEEAVGVLVEMLADDRARRSVADEVLASAILAVAAAEPTTRHVEERVARLVAA